jgi:GNAT superfamily N-acetyltransferase
MGGMWQLTEDVEAFAATAGDFLRSRPVEHTVFLTLIDAFRRRGMRAYGSGAPIFGAWRTDDGATDGVLLQTPPYPMLFSRLPAGAVAAAVDAVADRPLPGVNMLTADADEFVAGWQKRTGAAARRGMRVRLYRLDELIPPPRPAGAARVATAGDRDLLLRWFPAFHEDLGNVIEADHGAVIDDRLSYGGIMLWEVDGTAVATASRSRLDSAMVRIQMVYTPREHRGHGYAAAVTAAVSRSALDLGATDVVLFTDLDYPTSNGVYQRIGYRPVLDRVVMEFSS